MPIEANPGRVWLAQIASEVEKEVGGRVVSDEEVRELKEGAVGEVRRKMEEGERAMEAAKSLGPSTSSSRASSPASVFACDSGSVQNTIEETKIPKLGQVGRN